MSLISLDIALARQVASIFTSSAGNFGSELQTLKASAESVMATWQGNSRNDFESQWTDYTQRLLNLIDVLENLSGGLKREADEFEAADRAF